MTLAFSAAAFAACRPLTEPTDAPLDRPFHGSAAKKAARR